MANLFPRPECWYMVECVNHECPMEEAVLVWGPQDFDRFYCAKCKEEMHVSYHRRGEEGEAANSQGSVPQAKVRSGHRLV